MRLDRVSYVNYCQHRQCVLDLHPGLNALVGPNGAGKSNLLHGLVWALTGHDRNVGNNADNICQRAGPGEPAAVTVELCHAGARLVLTRRLRPAGQELVVGAETLKRDADIARKLQDVLGVAPRLLLEHVFVAQWGMFDFLEHTEARRAEAFGRLFGLAKTELIYQALGEARQEAQLEAPALTLDEPTLEARLGELAGQREQAQTAIADLASQLPEDWRETTDLAYRLLRQHEEDERRRAQQDRLTMQEQALAGQAQELASAWAARQAELVVVQEALRGPDALAELRQQLAAWQSYQEHTAQRARLEEQLQELGARAPAEPARPEPYWEPDAPALQELAGWGQERQRYEKFLATFQSGRQAHCPTCGTPARLLRERVDDVLVRLGELDALIGPAQAAAQASAAYRTALEGWRQAAGRQRTEQARLEGRLEGLRRLVAPAGPPESELRRLLQEQEELAAGARILAAETAELERRRAQVHGRLESVRAELAELPSPASAVLAADQREEARRQLARRAEQAQERARWRGELARIVILEEQPQRELAQARERAQQAARVRAAAGHLEAVRQVFHRDNLPRRLITAYLQELQADINQLLSRFAAPFRLAGVDGLRFLVEAPDGRRHPAERLSGGQRVLFALAFRVAVHRLCAGQLGLLCLDEPTAGLDRENRACLRVALQELRRLSQSQGLQVVVVTHDAETQAYDRVHDLSRPDG